jgi:hypothetical protein
VSADGVTWTSHPVETSDSGGAPVLVQFDTIAAYGNGLLAAGAGSDGVIRLWRSADGLIWEPVTDPTEILLPDDASVSAIAVVNDRVILAGGLLNAGDGFVAVGPAP